MATKKATARAAAEAAGEAPLDVDGYVDVEIKVAPYINKKTGAEISAPKLTARGLLTRLRENFRPYEAAAWPRATLAERYLNGDQWGGLSGTRNETVVDDAWAKTKLPRISYNLLRNDHLTRVARVTKGDPSAKAFGGDGTYNDLDGAMIANKIIEWQRNTDDHRKTISRAAWTVDSQSCCAFYPSWDPSAGPVDETGQPAGDFVLEALSVFDWGTDGAEDDKKSDACFIRRWLSPDDARMRLLEIGVATEPKISDAKSAHGQSRPLVECFLVYHKKTLRIPTGFYCMIVSGHVVEHRDVYPYEHGELPLIVWKCNDKFDSPHGGTHMDDAVPIQALLNRLHASMAKLISKTAEWMIWIGPSKVNQQLRDGMQMIDSDDNDATSAVRIITAPGPSALLMSQIATTESALHQAMGINESVSGNAAADATKSARQLAYVSELDAQKFAMSIVARDSAIVRIYSQMIKLYQQFAKTPRIAKTISRVTGMLELTSFIGDALVGVDVMLEPASGVEETRTAIAADEEQSAVAGFEDPARAGELRQTGQRETRAEVIGRRAIQVGITQALQGYQVQTDLGIPANVAVEELQRAIEQHTYIGHDVTALQALLAAYQAQAAQQQTPAETPTKAPNAAPPPQPSIT